MEPKKKKQRTLGVMFGHKPSTLPKKMFRGVPLQGVGMDFWYARESVLIRRMPNCNYNSPKVASFDFDSCLVDDTTWQWNANKPLPIRPGVIEKLRTLHQENYRLVIFTNEKTISMRKEKKSIENAINKKISRLNEFVRTLGCPMEMFVATGGDGDEYRKGSTPGMWNLLSEDCTKYGDSTCIKNDVPPNVSESFFVGDAAGRAADHSNT
jgi:bifunctional polynucleotide phosphatase/kinase